MPSMCRVVPFIPINFVEFIVIHIVAFLVSSTFNFFVLFGLILAVFCIVYLLLQSEVIGQKQNLKRV